MWAVGMELHCAPGTCILWCQDGVPQPAPLCGSSQDKEGWRCYSWHGGMQVCWGVGLVGVRTERCLGCSSHQSAKEQWIFMGLQEVPPRWGEGPEGGLTETKLISQRHLSVADIR